MRGTVKFFNSQKGFGFLVGPATVRALLPAFPVSPGMAAQAGSARQFAAWKSQSLVTVRSRPLRYQPTAWSMGRPAAWRAEEKGIDVMMALDIAIGARDDAYDVAVVVSADTDLAPAIEVALDAGKRVETAMWWSPEHPHRRMKVRVGVCGITLSMPAGLELGDRLPGGSAGTRWSGVLGAESVGGWPVRHPRRCRSGTECRCRSWPRQFAIWPLRRMRC